MSYTPTTWTTGDTITASAMNKIEQGIANGGSGVMIVTTSNQGGNQTMDKTVQEIHDALMNGTPVYYKYQYGTIGADYVAHAWLAPITYVYTYDTTNVIRVVVQRAFFSGASATGSASTSYALVPSVILFEANSLNAYPTFYRTVYPTASTTMASQNILAG